MFYYTVHMLDNFSIFQNNIENMIHIQHVLLSVLCHCKLILALNYFPVFSLYYSLKYLFFQAL